MKLEGIKTPCHCRLETCDGQRLTQLHLYAQSDADVETLQLLLDALVAGSSEPLQSTDAIVTPEILLPVLDRVKVAAARNN